MEKILITGGSGFLGGYLVNTAIKGYEVYATYYTHVPDLKEVSWVNLDLSNTDAVKQLLKEIKPRFIIHNGAMARVDDCENQQNKARAVNVDSSGIIAETAQKIGARILYISTDLIFAGDNPPYKEKDTPSPISYYGWTKWQGEMKVEDLNPNHVIIRPGILFGPPALSGTSFSEWMRKSWLKGSSTPLFVDQFRTPLFAGTLAQSVYELLDHSYTGYIHIAGKESKNRFDFGIVLAKHLGIDLELLKPIKMADLPSKVVRPADVSLNIDNAMNLLKKKLPNIQDDIRLAYPQKYRQ